MTIFGLPPQIATIDLRQWEPILQWLRPLLYPPQAANDTVAAAGASPAAHRQAVASSKPVSASQTMTAGASGSPSEALSTKLGRTLSVSLMPAQESLVHGGRLSMHGPGRFTGAPVLPHGKPAMTRNVNLSDGQQLAQFLKRAT